MNNKSGTTSPSKRPGEGRYCLCYRFRFTLDSLASLFPSWRRVLFTDTFLINCYFMATRMTVRARCLARRGKVFFALNATWLPMYCRLLQLHPLPWRFQALVVKSDFRPCKAKKYPTYTFLFMSGVFHPPKPAKYDCDNSNYVLTEEKWKLASVIWGKTPGPCTGCWLTLKTICWDKCAVELFNTSVTQFASQLLYPL